VVGGFFAGIVFWGGFNTVVEATNTEEFCIGCHEMRDNVYEEYKKTIHYNNRTGVRAVCSDCHVPKDWGTRCCARSRPRARSTARSPAPSTRREKFEAKRLELAEHEWKRMKANDSLECRNCHSLVSMDPRETEAAREEAARAGAARQARPASTATRASPTRSRKGMKEEDDE
jgi:cytochrome c-type protein NapC